MAFKRVVFSLLSTVIFSYCVQNSPKAIEKPDTDNEIKSQITIGAANFRQYIPLITNKKIALVVNQTSVVGERHLVDTLLAQGIEIVKIFAPEHGFRGTADAGEKVDNAIDNKTGIPLISLYGKSKKPTQDMLMDIDVVLFDIQDVGARFFTYISTMHYVMESCAEFDKEFLVLDRPNPHANYIDGPVLDSAFKSFIGMHEIPISHGLTVGELAYMINEERWLKNQVKCKLQVIRCDNYSHSKPYLLPIKPSPNLPDNFSVALYPSLCLFEGTVMSLGRGTKIPFQIVGYPDKKFGDFTFTPKSIPGMSRYPKHENKQCWGVNFKGKPMNLKASLEHMIDCYNKMDDKAGFFLKSFPLLAGNDKLQQQITTGMSASDIVETWQPALNEYKTLRSKYLLYPEK